jgi:hypothetical protein
MIKTRLRRVQRGGGASLANVWFWIRCISWLRRRQGALALHPLAAKLAQQSRWNLCDDLLCKKNHFFCGFWKGIFH